MSDNDRHDGDRHDPVGIVTDDNTDTAAAEADERAEIEDIRARIGNLPNALGLAARLNSGVIEDSAALDMRTVHLVRVAAMAATGMPRMGWEVNIELMEDDVSADDVDAVLAAIAPIIGTARYLDAITTLTAD